MNQDNPENLYIRLSRIIEEKTALYFNIDRWKDLEHKTETIAKELGFAGIYELLSYLESSNISVNQIKVIAGHLTNGETYFWREPALFDTLQRNILPELVASNEKKGRKLRIWSAGCSSGEEPYSIAIALRRTIPDIGKWNISILATDINPRVISKARKAVYSRNSFRNAPDWLKEKYFNALDNGKLELHQNVRKMVTFDYLNLADFSYPSQLNGTIGMDLIFCRNVLMYFQQDRVAKVAHHFYNALSENGWLIVSSSELSQQIFSRFTPVNYQDAIVYIKGRKKTISPKKHTELIEPQISEVVMGHRPIKKNIINKGLSYPELKDKSNLSASEAKPEERKKSIEDISGRLEPAKMIKLLADRGNLQEAAEQCEKAVMSDKLNTELRFLLAAIYQESGKTESSISSLKHVIYLDPDYLIAYYMLGNLYLRGGNRKKAVKNFLNAKSLLRQYKKDDIIPGSEGLTAGRLGEVIEATIHSKILL